MIFFLITLVFSIVGLIGFYTDNYTLTIIAGIVYILENLRGYFTGQLKSLFPTIFVGFIGFIIGRNNNNIFPTICVALCYEDIIVSILSIPLLFMAIKAVNENEKNQEIQENEEAENNVAPSIPNEIYTLLSDKDKIKNIINGIEEVDENLFLGFTNPYNKKRIENLNDIKEYLSSFLEETSNIDN